MALTWIEDGDSRQATIVRRGRKAASTMTKSYKLFGTANDVEVHAAVNQQISTVGYGWQYPGVPDAQLWVESYSITFLGDNAWQVTINYEKTGAEPDTPDPLRRARSFDTTGSTQHITQALYETPFPSGAPFQYNAIGVDSNGVNGVDIVSPQLQWQEQYDVPNAYINATYVRGLAGMTGTTNIASFRGFAAGEVLFLGCSGSQEWDDQKGKGPWSLSYRFVASPNAGSGQSVPAITIGSISGITKKGHDYLWVRYEDAVDASTLLKKPKHVYVDRVYRESDFSQLGIGTGYV
jgi:hypothetical protein